MGRGAFHREMKALEAQTFDPGRTRYVIVNSEMVRREIETHFKFPSERIRLIRNGVATRRFANGDRAATRARFGIAEKEFLLLFVGSGWERKGLKYTLAATGALRGRGVKLLVVGKGRQPSPVPANVIFAGPVAEVEHAYAAADALVFLPIYEPASNVVFEARASGLPVVTTQYNGAAEIIERREEGCVINDPRDQNEVLAAIEWHLRQGPRRVPATQDLSLERNVRETIAVLEVAATSR